MLSVVRSGTQKGEGGVQSEDGHAADVDCGEHEEQLVAEVRLERRRHFGHHKAYMGIATSVSYTR